MARRRNTDDNSNFRTASCLVILLAAPTLTALTKNLFTGVMSSSWLLRLLVITFVCMLVYHVINLIMKPGRQAEVEKTEEVEETEKAEEAAAEQAESGQGARGITAEYFDLCDETARSLYRFMKKRSGDEKLLQAIDGIGGLESIDEGIYYPGLDNRVATLVLIDLANCYTNLGHRFGGEKEEVLCPALTISKMLNPGNKIEYATVGNLYGTAMPHIIRLLEMSDRMSGPRESRREDFMFAGVLRRYDPESVAEYLSLMYRYASVVAKADGQVTESESAYLSTLIKGNPEGKGGKRKKGGKAGKEPSGDPIKELGSLIGLEPVKAEVVKLSNYIKIQQIRDREGLKSTAISYHCVFTGNPGTGKTTVARIIAGIYRDLGVLGKGHLVETDRSGLVAEYVGQTAVKTNKIIDSALDGVLFIDEAYSLTQGGGNDYGMEAISTLLKRMEDDRERLIVILAGYTDDMQDFLSSNPGLQSRFNRFINFPDYSVEDLMAIYRLNVGKLDYRLTPEAEEKLRRTVEKAVAQKDEKFGNGRYVRNLFEKTLENQATRLSSRPDITRTLLQEITPEDIP